MKAKLYNGNSFFMLHPNTKVSIVDQEAVSVSFLNGKAVYKHQEIEHSGNLIVQAKNIKRAVNLFMIEKKCFNCLLY